MIRTLVCGVGLFMTGASLLADELRTLGGQTLVGNLAAISDADIKLQTETGLVATPLAQVLLVELRQTKGIPAGVKYTDVRLLDDSMLHCQSVALKGNDAELMLLSGTKVKLPINFISWMVQDAQNPTLRKK